MFVLIISASILYLNLDFAQAEGDANQDRYMNIVPCTGDGGATYTYGLSCATWGSDCYPSSHCFCDQTVL